jgi:predicted enzyme related to lactoylglutathione lyase
MQLLEKLTMFQVAVSDMAKAKAFYTEGLGLKLESDYRRDDDNWWVSMSIPGCGVVMTLTTHHAHMKPGTLTLYFATSDVTAIHKALKGKGVEVSDLKDDLHGPGSGVRWFNFQDPEGNLIHIEQT